MLEYTELYRLHYLNYTSLYMYHLHLTLFTLVAARVSDYSVIFGDRRGSIRGIIESPSTRPYLIILNPIRSP